MNYASEPADRNSSGLRVAILVEGGLAVLGLALAWLLDVPLRKQFPQDVPAAVVAVLWGIVATLPLVAIFWWLLLSEHPELRRLRGQVHWLVDELFRGASVAQLALVAVLAGVGEELLFRGVLLPLAARWTTPLVALVATSLLFGLAHAMSRLYFLLATLIGFYFGWLSMEFGLVPAMVTHGLYDLVALVYLSKWPRP